jgi:hypothetical protein
MPLADADAHARRAVDLLPRAMETGRRENPRELDQPYFEPLRGLEDFVALRARRAARGEPAVG